jgi:basic membrane protein A
MKKFTKILTLLMALCMFCTMFAACGSKEAAEEKPATESKEEVKEEGNAKKACLLTTSPLGNDFSDIVWSGFKELEAAGWEVKCIEVSEAAEYPDQIRAMAAEGYTVMFTMFDELSQVALDLSDELAEKYPDLHVLMLDTYMEHDKANCTSVSVDPFESSFVAGFIAANVTEKDIVGWIGHKDILKIQRFRDGYIAGVNYADKGVEVVAAFTGAPKDPIKGQETARAMIQNNDIDLIYQTNYLGGPGVIAACAEAGIKCIGVDSWQGDIDPCVFWSAVKPMNIAVVSLANQYLEGAEFKTSIDFNLRSGGAVYDKRDEGNISPELLAEVKQLIEDIRSGKIDVFEGFDQYRLKY